MKTVILSFTALLISTTAICQTEPVQETRSGKIIFEEVIKLDIKLEGDAASFAGSLPKEQSSLKALLFNDQSSLYMKEEEKDDREMMTPQQSHMTIRIMSAGGNEKTFTDFLNGKQTGQKEFMTRMFLVESEISASGWKITGNAASVLGYNCIEAVREENETKINAWFTPSIPVQGGPANFCGLPGMILKVNINDGKQVITARSIDTSFASFNLIVKPAEGRKMTPEEYKKMVGEKMKEMGLENGQGNSGNHVFIRVRN